jgi:hypothetical protein
MPDELAAIILQSASEQISPFLGGPLSLTGLWLVPQFPSRPPPEYVRAGYAWLHLNNIPLMNPR